MKLSLDSISDRNTVHSYDETHVSIRLMQAETLKRVDQSFILMPSQLIENWAASHFSQLDHTDFEPLLALKPDIILCASPDGDLMPNMEMLAYFAQHQIGVEFMRLGAACRTYNVLLSEDRDVLFAVIF